MSGCRGASPGRTPLGQLRDTKPAPAGVSNRPGCPASSGRLRGGGSDGLGVPAGQAQFSIGTSGVKGGAAVSVPLPLRLQFGLFRAARRESADADAHRRGEELGQPGRVSPNVRRIPRATMRVQEIVHLAQTSVNSLIWHCQCGRRRTIPETCRWRCSCGWRSRSTSPCPGAHRRRPCRVQTSRSTGAWPACGD
jgi:hypothetical protein